jgi:hypothetical protein
MRFTRRCGELPENSRGARQQQPQLIGGSGRRSLHPDPKISRPPSAGCLPGRPSRSVCSCRGPRPSSASRRSPREQRGARSACFPHSHPAGHGAQSRFGPFRSSVTPFLDGEYCVPTANRHETHPVLVVATQTTATAPRLNVHVNLVSRTDRSVLVLSRRLLHSSLYRFLAGHAETEQHASR